MPSKCPLCENVKLHHFVYQKSLNRNFYECENCFLIFVDRSELLSNTEEKSRYDLHENHIRTKGYEKFLRRVINPIKDRVDTSAHGLDYGEGPYPMMREIFAEDGFKNIKGFDPYYNKNTKSLQSTYDFITCCEVIEHTNNPKKELETMMNLLRMNGLLGISTGIYSHEHDFLGWQYTHDDTHINIFTHETLQWLKSHYDLNVAFESKDFILFLKKQKAAQL